MTMAVIAVFPTTHLTLRAEKALKEAGVSHRTVMKPRRISSDCGLAVSLDHDVVDKAMEALDAKGLNTFDLYRQAGDDWEPADP